MKYVGPAIFLLTTALCYSILFAQKLTWFLGGLVVAAVFVGIIITVIADVKDRKQRDY